VYSVEFKGYADSPPVTLGPQDLKPLQDHSKYHKSNSGGAAATDSTAEAAGGDKKRKDTLDAGSAGIKKKKAPGAGSEQVQKQMAWQNFSKGGAKKAKGGPIMKKSIFATPDNPEGRGKIDLAWLRSTSFVQAPYPDIILRSLFCSIVP